jgi:hypothetical protein
LNNKPDQHFLNDLTISTNGDVYLTDTVRGAIYFIPSKADELTEFLSFDKTSYPNGIDLSADEKTLFVALNGKIAAIDLRSRKSLYLSMPQDIKVGIIDGLYFYKNSLVAIQPFEAGKTIVRYRLNDKQTSVIKAEIIEASHRLQNQPTTGVIVEKAFYYLANSQLQLFRKMFQPDGSFDRSKLTDVYVLRLGI